MAADIGRRHPGILTLGLCVPCWACSLTHNSTPCKVTKVSGGITNLLLKLSPPPQHEPVLVRVFGDNTDIVIDRKAEEIVSLQLHKAGFGAKVLRGVLYSLSPYLGDHAMVLRPC